MSSLQESIQKDQQDLLYHFREQFYFPFDQEGSLYYFCGNSLGLQPRRTQDYVLQELKDWSEFAVEGHTEALRPWVHYHEFLTEPMAQVVGALPHEVIVMNTLTVNLHLMMVSFYNPGKRRNKILIEYSAFPSDRYAIESQIRYHGLDPKETLIVLQPNQDNDYVSIENVSLTLEKYGEEIALVLIGSVNYYTGQAYSIPQITKLAHQYGCRIGFDLAHGAGNLLLNLHNDGPDFAVWCSYKYLNSGPGSLAGCFVHERHADNFDLPRFTGWWGHNKIDRFKMSAQLELMRGAEGWQLSNPPILPMACMLASLQMFSEAGMKNLRMKSLSLSRFLIQLLQSINHSKIKILTPINDEERGSQVSIQIQGGDKSIYTSLKHSRIIADWREPDVIRVAPVPLYNSFQDVFYLYDSLKSILEKNG
ncbi:MAG: kynureninase [Saprospiraceae bacterium]|nr:kynureninase [Saprospiraceae bacterium]